MRTAENKQITSKEELSEILLRHQWYVSGNRKTGELIGASLSNRIIDGFTFENCNLSGAIIRNTTFHNCAFSGISFLGANISADFKNCKITSCNFNRSKFYRTTFVLTTSLDCSYLNGEIYNTSIKNSVFRNCNFSLTDFHDLTIIKSTLEGFIDETDWQPTIQIKKEEKALIKIGIKEGRNPTPSAL